MPVYEYACTECGSRLEMRQSFTDDALTICPDCSGRLRKLLSPVGVVFKGSGFYRNDSRGAPPAESSAGTASGDGTSSDSKSSAGGGPASDGNGTTAPKSTPAKETAASRSGSARSAKPEVTGRTSGRANGSKAAR